MWSASNNRKYCAICHSLLLLLLIMLLAKMAVYNGDFNQYQIPFFAHYGMPPRVVYSLPVRTKTAIFNYIHACDRSCGQLNIK